MNVKSYATILWLGALICTGRISAATHAEGTMQEPRSVRHEGRHYPTEADDKTAAGDRNLMIRYRINAAKLEAALAGNEAALAELDSLMHRLLDGNCYRIERITVTGYASPDGPRERNEELARNRAADFRRYLDRKYDLDRQFRIEERSVAEDWEALRALVEAGSMHERQRLLDLLESRRTDDAKEVALKQMGTTWTALKRDILPQLRRVEMEVAYTHTESAECPVTAAEPTPAPAPRPTPEPAAEPRSCRTAEVCNLEEDISGLIVEFPDALLMTRR